ncbi:MAG: hypothetical protein ABIB61_00555 [Candidatus Shapirobacteria bacterium]
MVKKQNFRKVNLKGSVSDLYEKALVGFFRLLPPDLIPRLHHEIFKAPFFQRTKIWQDWNLPIKIIEKKFVQLTMARQQLAKKQGYSSFLQLILEKHKIPRRDYDAFIKSIDRQILVFNKQLSNSKPFPSWYYSKFGRPCAICLAKSFPFNNLNEVLDSVIEKERILKKFESQIKINLGKNSAVNYKNKANIFAITIDKNLNNRHQMADLIHELSHVVAALNSFQKKVDYFQKGAYWREKEALKVEMRVLKKQQDIFWQNLIIECLLVWRRELFEIELYRDPNQDLSKLYAQTFNRCFPGAKQKSNPLYLLDERIILAPFSSLPHALAQFQVFVSS